MKPNSDVLSPLYQLFKEHFGTVSNLHQYFAPGRINLIGEHLDYNGGLVMPATLTMGITALVRRRNDSLVRMISTEYDREISFDLHVDLQPRVSDGWGNYPKGIFAHLKNRCLPIKGVDILFSSSLPQGAGLSSSAALEVLTCYLALAEAGIEALKGVELATICKEVENNFIGVQCGVMDQFSVALGKEGHALLLNCQNLDFDYIPVELGDYRIVVMNSNKPRALVESKYNERKNECEAALKFLQKKHAVQNLAEVSLDMMAECLVADNTLFRRVRHIVTEQQRVVDCARYMKLGLVHQIGEILTASHRSLCFDYEVTGFELDTMVQEAIATEGCLGARMTGAGFGGCAIALVHQERIPAFTQSLKERYSAITGLTPEFYSSTIGPGVMAQPVMSL